MTTNCLLLSHVFVQEGENDKLDMIEFTLNHYRFYNPNLYIILTGHGIVPDHKTLSLCDDWYWNNNIVESDINVGHPKLVGIGLEMARNANFSKILKCRSDGIIMRSNIHSYCDNILKEELSNMLITQQTSFDELLLGDLFNYGYIDFMIDCFSESNWNYSYGYCGRKNIAINFCKKYLKYPIDNDGWIAGVKDNFSFRNVESIRWIDFRANWGVLKNMQSEMMDLSSLDKVDYSPYMWGHAEGWHNSGYIKEDEFYK